MILPSKIIIASKPRYRRCIAVDETKLCVKGVWYMYGLSLILIQEDC